MSEYRLPGSDDMGGASEDGDEGRGRGGDGGENEGVRQSYEAPRSRGGGENNSNSNHYYGALGLNAESLRSLRGGGGGGKRGGLQMGALPPPPPPPPPAEKSTDPKMARAFQIFLLRSTFDHYAKMQRTAYLDSVNRTTFRRFARDSKLVTLLGGQLDVIFESSLCCYGDSSMHSEHGLVASILGGGARGGKGGGVDGEEEEGGKEAETSAVWGQGRRGGHPAFGL